MASVDWNAALSQYLNIGATPAASLGGLFATLGGACQSAVERYLGRTFDVVERTESYNGTGKCTLYLNWDPIVSVSALTVNGSSVTVGDLLAPAYPPEACVIVSQQYLQRTDAIFPRGISNVLVTYRAGLADPDLLVPPPELVFAVTYWAALFFKDRDRLGLSSNVVGTQTTAFTRVVPDSIKLMVSGWKRGLKPTC